MLNFFFFLSAYLAENTWAAMIFTCNVTAALSGTSASTSYRRQQQSILATVLV
jgi:hypothetical protein